MIEMRWRHLWMWTLYLIVDNILPVDRVLDDKSMARNATIGHQAISAHGWGRGGWWLELEINFAKFEVLQSQRRSLIVSSPGWKSPARPLRPLCWRPNVCDSMWLWISKFREGPFPALLMVQIFWYWGWLGPGVGAEWQINDASAGQRCPAPSKIIKMVANWDTFCHLHARH